MSSILFAISAKREDEIPTRGGKQDSELAASLRGWFAARSLGRNSVSA